MGGHGLDRFSRYGFDAFQNTLRGYPTSTLRYDRGGVVRGALTWNAARQVRLDGFLDMARVRDPGIHPRSRTYVGLGAGLEAPLPLRALGSVEWGYGFQARGRSGQGGTHVVRVTAYKIF
jgi:hemolysin activation/secretion protein